MKLLYTRCVLLNRKVNSQRVPMYAEYQTGIGFQTIRHVTNHDRRPAFLKSRF